MNVRQLRRFKPSFLINQIDVNAHYRIIYIYLRSVYIISKTITKYKYNGVAALGF